MEWVDNLGRNVAIFDTTGISLDGWCERTVTFKIGVSAALSACELEIWLKPQRERRTSRFVADFGEGPFAFELPHDQPTRVQIGCHADRGDVVEGSIACDNAVLDKGDDERALSFRLSSIRFW